VKFSRRRRIPADINLTPLIDILFLVLVFLVVTASFTDRTVLPIVLPHAATADTLQAPRDGILIAIDAAGVLYLNGEQREPDEIRRALQAVADPAAVTVTVAADERTPHGRVVQVLDLAREAGMQRLDIQTFRDPAAGTGSR
jgi:biopolymer transport protein ExbD